MKRRSVLWFRTERSRLSYDKNLFPLNEKHLGGKNFERQYFR